ALPIYTTPAPFSARVARRPPAPRVLGSSPGNEQYGIQAAAAIDSSARRECFVHRGALRVVPRVAEQRTGGVAAFLRERRIRARRGRPRTDTRSARPPASGATRGRRRRPRLGAHRCAGQREAGRSLAPDSGLQPARTSNR